MTTRRSPLRRIDGQVPYKLMQSPYLKARKNAKRGFTLIELLVVVLIIGVLLAIAIPLYLSSVRNSSTVATKANLREIGLASQSYYVKEGKYPTSLGQITGSAPFDIPPAFTSGTLGPRDVTYQIISGEAGPFQAQADENAVTDVFGTPAKESMVFDLQSNTYTIN
jgi:prepilin-type N-terminal cleavage/methylation domain-containing protein